MSRRRQTGRGPVPPPPERDEQDRELFLRALETMAPLPGREKEGGEVRRPSRSGVSRRPGKGAVFIEAALDLHGLTKDETLFRLEHFLTGAARRGLRTVLVITGKGVNSPEGPVLKGAVEAWLRGRGRTMIAEFSEAPRDKGGSGAFVVVLKKTGRR